MQMRRRVRSSGMNGVDAGVMCGFGVGYGFGAGLVLKPSALHQLQLEARKLTGSLSFTSNITKLTQSMCISVDQSSRPLAMPRYVSRYMSQRSGCGSGLLCKTHANVLCASQNRL